MEKSYLVLWSGGFDSTYVVAKLLKDTKFPIHAHHIQIWNKTKRAEEENKACRELLKHLRKIRSFGYSESIINHTGYAAIPYDMALVCFEAGACAKNLKALGNPVSHWTIGTHLKEGHWQQRWEKLEKITEAVCWEHDAPQFELLPLVPKKEELRFLKKEGLVDYPWHCRTPKDGKECGMCEPCLEVDLIREQLNIK